MTSSISTGFRRLIRAARSSGSTSPTTGRPWPRCSAWTTGTTRIDAVVHLAAIPAPGLTTNAATFDNNITSTYHVFAAARAAKIKTVVWASSETVLGLPFGPDSPPPYIPVDEEYHPRPSSSYSLAKTLEEEMAGQFCRWDPELSMTGLRFSNVMEPADYAAFPAFDDDPALRVWNLWGYIDARDGAQAVRLALAASRPGMDVFVIAAADTVMSRSSADLAAGTFPGGADHPGAGRARDPAGHRQGPPGPGFRAAAQLARSRRTAGGPIVSRSRIATTAAERSWSCRPGPGTAAIILYAPVRRSG